MVRSHMLELLAQPRPRNAYDRCHTQKLRCLKAQDDESCLRCTKFGARCVFSPRLPCRRLQRQANCYDAKDGAKDEDDAGANADSAVTAPTEPMGLSDVLPLSHAWSQPSLDMDMDFPALDLSAFPNLDDALIDPTNQTDLWNTQPLPSLLDQSHSPTLADAARELADLNVKLLDHDTTLPPPLNPSSPDTLPAGKLLAIDQTFTLTKTLIQNLRQLYLIGEGPIDQATVLLFLSCYYRLTDIYESIFMHMRSCAQNSRLPTPENEVVTLPPLRIGSYIPNQLLKAETGSALPISAFSMHMVLVMILSAQLCEQLRDVIAAGISHAEGGLMVLETRVVHHDSMKFGKPHQLACKEVRTY